MNFIERLPTPLIGSILVHLTKLTGDPEVINEADIPVVMRYACNLACTSKQMAQKVNSFMSTELFLQSLAQKYHQPPEELAARLKTVGAHIWLLKYIEKQKFDKDHAMIHEVLNSDIFKKQQKTNSVEPFLQSIRCQTKQGLGLCLDFWVPAYLATPFGKIDLYNRKILKHNLLHRVQNGWGKISSYFKPVHTFDLEVSFGKRRLLKEELEEILNKHNRQSNLISEYAITSINSHPIPPLIWYQPTERKRSFRLVQMMWHMLEKKRLGQDPTIKTLQDKKSKIHHYKDPFFQNLKEIPLWAIDLIRKLLQQPWENHSVPTKRLFLKANVNAELAERLHYSAYKYLKNKEDLVLLGYEYRYAPQHPGEEGGFLECLCKEKKLFVDLNELKIAYESVINDLRKGWIQTKLKNYPDILCRQSEEDYLLFVSKKGDFHNKYYLLMHAINNLRLSKYVHCNERWQNNSSEDIYLWIHKKWSEAILKKLELETSG